MTMRRPSRLIDDRDSAEIGVLGPWAYAAPVQSLLTARVRP